MLLLLLACGPKKATETAATAPIERVEASCDRPEGMFGPVLRDDALHSDAKRFSELSTTQESPVEVCMVEGQLSALTSLTCDDGSNPFADMGQAHAARVGNTGPGGRCGSIIDVYEVPCPEATYEVHMDMYVCPSS